MRIEGQPIEESHQFRASEPRGIFLDTSRQQQLFKDNLLNLSPEILYPPRLESQVETIINRLKKFNSLKPEQVQMAPENYTFLSDYYARIISQRTKRTYEVESPAYERVKKLAKSLFPRPINLTKCMDGRLTGERVYGLTAGMARILRAPGVILDDIVRGVDGKMKVLKDSKLARKLKRSILEDGRTVEAVDAHVKCAARKIEEGKRGKEPTDEGLASDILYKKEITTAMKDFVGESLGDSTRIMPIITTYNPENGYMFMGLETEHALGYAVSQSEDGTHQLTPKVVKDLYTQSHLPEGNSGIIYTKSFVRQKSFQEAFAKYGNFEPDWENNFVQTSQNFWEAIAAMKPQLLPLIEKKVLKVYPELETDPEELESRAMLLLCNTFRAHLGGLNPDHVEGFIKLTDYGQPPYVDKALVIGDIKNFPDAVEKASGIIRDNRGREKNPIQDPTGNFPTPSEFKKAVVPIIALEMVHEEVPDAEWERWANLDWSSMSSTWHSLSDSEFFLHLNVMGAPGIRDEIAKKAMLADGNETIFYNALEAINMEIPAVASIVNRLRRKMAELYDPGSATSAHLIEHYKIALPVVADKHRRIQLAIPFIKYGVEA